MLQFNSKIMYYEHLIRFHDQRLTHQGILTSKYEIQIIDQSFLSDTSFNSKKQMMKNIDLRQRLN